MKRRHILAWAASICAFALIAAGALLWSNAQISSGYLEILGNQAKGYASMAAQSIRLSDERVAQLEQLSYDELLASPENRQLAELFQNDTLQGAVDYAYVMVRLPDDQVTHYVADGEGQGYDAPDGTPLNIMWLLDVNVADDVAPLDADADGSATEWSRFTYETPEDERILANAPLYTVNDDEWGRHIAGYAPILSTSGAPIGVVGVDLSVTAYDEHVSLAVGVLIVLLVVIVGVLAAIFALLSRQHRRDARKLQVQEERYRILIDSTITLTFDYDPDADVLAYTAYGDDGKLHERIVERYVARLDEVSHVGSQSIGIYREAIAHACASSDSAVTDFQADMGMGMRWYKARYASVVDDRGHVYRVVGRLDDIQREKDIERRADRDALSGVYNRAGAEERIQQALEGTLLPAAFILIDIDDFKRINDTMGHGQGDAVIRHVGEALSTMFRHDDTVYRLGGDEFAVFLQAPRTEGLVRAKASTLLRETEEYSRSLGWDFPVSLSIGIALSNGAMTLDELYKAADDALYRSKDAGKGRFTIAAQGDQAPLSD